MGIFGLGKFKKVVCAISARLDTVVSVSPRRWEWRSESRHHECAKLQPYVGYTPVCVLGRTLFFHSGIAGPEGPAVGRTH